MRKIYFLIPVVLIFIIGAVWASGVFRSAPVDNLVPVVPTPATTAAGLSNPASENCVNKGGSLKLVTGTDGGQFGMCEFPEYSCEEWVFFRNECDVAADAEKIRQRLVEKNLNLSNMTVVIRKHLGKYIEGVVVPVTTQGGGGYVFAVKAEGEISVLADGNGIVSCSAFANYPDFSTYLLPQCVDDAGNLIIR